MTNSVLRDFPADQTQAFARGLDLVEAVSRLRLGELMVLLSADQAGPVNELMDPRGAGAGRHRRVLGPRLGRDPRPGPRGVDPPGGLPAHG